MNNEVPNTERVHHPYSPSSLQSREACPKFQNRNSTNEAAVFGTIQHDAVERGQDDSRLSDDRASAVADCMIFCDERASHYPGGTILKEAYLPIDEEVIVITVKSIERFDIVTEDGQVCPGFRQGETKHHVFEGTTAGFLDFAVISADETEADIVDYKFGRNAVTSAEDNLQGIAYMLGLKKRFPKLRKCRVSFIQPHIDEMSEHTFGLSDTSEFYLRIRVVVGRSIAAAANPHDFSSARPNVGTCLFCALVGKCTKVGDLMLKLGQKYKPLAIPANVNPTTLSDPKDVDMGIRLADVVKVWAEAFRRQATEKTIENMDFVPEGYTLVTMQKRKILHSRNFAKIAKDFLPEPMWKEVDNLFDIPITPVEDLISASAPRGSKEACVEAFGAKLIEAGVVELGNPFAFLRQSKKSDKGKVAPK
jgi:hypothetical protein